MTWEQKLAALDAFAGRGELGMREPGDWYCSHHIEIKDGGLLRGGCGNGKTPQEAVEDQWRRVTENLQPGQYLVSGGYRSSRKAAKWNGYMWSEVDEKLSAA